MRSGRLKYFVYGYLLPYFGLLVVKIFSLTHRTRLLGGDVEDEVLKQEPGLIYASWHQRFFPGITFFAKRKPIAIMISQSRDGALIARIVQLLGWQPVRGSSSRAGREALDELRRLARSGSRIGHIVDGPRGPAEVVKPGLLRIAQAAGIPIVPTITSAEKKWVFKSWDRFMVPKPFSRVLIRFGEAMYVDADLKDERFEERRVHIEDRLKELYQETDQLWTNLERIEVLFSKRK